MRARFRYLYLKYVLPAGPIRIPSVGVVCLVQSAIDVVVCCEETTGLPERSGPRGSSPPCQHDRSHCV